MCEAQPVVGRGSSFYVVDKKAKYMWRLNPHPQIHTTRAQQLSFYKFELAGASFTLLALIIIVALFGLGGLVNAMRARTQT